MATVGDWRDQIKHRRTADKRNSLSDAVYAQLRHQSELKLAADNRYAAVKAIRKKQRRPKAALLAARANARIPMQ